MKFLIHLPPQKPFAPAKIRKPPFEFIRCPEHGDMHILNGRELTAEELNQVADSVFRSKFDWDYRMKPSIRVLVDASGRDEDEDQGETGSEADTETLTVDQENWILAKAEAILQRRTAPPVPGVTEETTAPVEKETAPPEGEASEPDSEPNETPETGTPAIDGETAPGASESTGETPPAETATGEAPESAPPEKADTETTAPPPVKKNKGGRPPKAK